MRIGSWPKVQTFQSLVFDFFSQVWVLPCDLMITLHACVITRRFIPCSASGNHSNTKMTICYTWPSSMLSPAVHQSVPSVQGAVWNGWSLGTPSAHSLLFGVKCKHTIKAPLSTHFSSYKCKPLSPAHWRSNKTGTELPEWIIYLLVSTNWFSTGTGIAINLRIGVKTRWVLPKSHRHEVIFPIKVILIGMSTRN